MKIAFLVIFILLLVQVNGQLKDEGIEFLEQFRQNLIKEGILKREDTLFYTAGIDTGRLSLMKRHFITDTLWIYKDLRNGKLLKIDSILVSKAEKKHIEDALSTQNGTIWEENLLSNTKLVPEDTTHLHFIKMLGDRKITWNEYKTLKFREVYSFSRPIFIKDNSICLFYWQAQQRGFRTSLLGLYRKRDCKWEFVQWYMIGG